MSSIEDPDGYLGERDWLGIGSISTLYREREEDELAAIEARRIPIGFRAREAGGLGADADLGESAPSRAGIVDDPEEARADT